MPADNGTGRPGTAAPKKKSTVEELVEIGVGDMDDDFFDDEDDED